MSFNRQHTILFPTINSVLNNWLHEIVYAVSYVLYLSFAFDIDHFYTPRLECLSELLEFCSICLTLCFQGLCLLGNKFFQFRNFRIFFLWRFVVLLSCLLSFLSCLFFLLLFLNSLLFLQILQLSFDSLFVENPIKPFLFVACQHKDHFWQLSSFTKQLNDTCRYFFLFHIKEVGIDENLTDSIENILDNLYFVGLAVKVSCFFQNLRIF